MGSLTWGSMWSMMCLVCGLGCVWSDQGVVCGSGMWPMVWEYIGLWFRVYVVCDV